MTSDEADHQTADYSNPDDSSIRSTPALNLDIDQIALLQARWALAVLLPHLRADLGDPTANYLLFGNRPKEGFFESAFEHTFLSIAPYDDCLVCQTNGESFTREDAESILANAMTTGSTTA